MTALLEVSHIDVGYGRTLVLHDLSLQVRSGEVTVLLGANGAGKTTALRAISNLMVRVTGEIRFSGERIERKATDYIARLGIAHVPDGRGTLTHLTVQENLRLGAYAQRSVQRVQEGFERIYGYFPALKRMARRQAGTLSGGEQQMLAIGRALMSRPRLLLLDEPSFGLAPIIVGEIFSILQEIKRNEGMSMLLVEQNASTALHISDQAYLLETGRIVMAGAPSLFVSDEAIRRAYLGY
jgi:branched-chain amino acid transport system ATP-binding protein